MKTSPTSLLQVLIALATLAGLGSLGVGIVMLTSDEPDETGFGGAIGQVFTAAGLLAVVLSIASILLVSRGSMVGPVLGIVAALAAAPIGMVASSWLTRGVLGPFDLMLPVAYLMVVCTLAVLVLGQMRETA